MEDSGIRCLTHFLYKNNHPSEGIPYSDGDICVVCGFPIDGLVPYKFPKTFTTTEYISGSMLDGTAKICKCCKYVYETQFYRNNCWFSNPSGSVKLERKDVIIRLFSEQPPFSIYTTNTYQKQGWLSILKSGIILSKNFFTFAWDMNMLQIHRNKLHDLVIKCLFLMDLGLTKTDLKTRAIPRKRYQNIPEALRLSVDRFLQENLFNLYWLWVVSFMPKVEENTEIKSFFNFDECCKDLFKDNPDEQVLTFVNRRTKKGNLLEFIGDNL